MKLYTIHLYMSDGACLLRNSAGRTKVEAIQSVTQGITHFVMDDEKIYFPPALVTAIAVEKKFSPSELNDGTD